MRLPLLDDNSPDGLGSLALDNFKEETGEVETADILFLPDELLERVLSLLPLRWLKTAAAVCCRWRRLAEGPRLWRGLRISVKQDNLSVMPEVMVLEK